MRTVTQLLHSGVGSLTRLLHRAAYFTEGHHSVKDAETHSFPSQAYTELHCFIWKRWSPEEPPGHPGKFLHCKEQQPWRNKHDGRRTLSHWLNSQQKKTCLKISLYQILLLWKQSTDHICKQLWKVMRITKHSYSSGHAMVMWPDKHTLCYSSLFSLNGSFWDH